MPAPAQVYHASHDRDVSRLPMQSRLERRVPFERAWQQLHAGQLRRLLWQWQEEEKVRVFSDAFSRRRAIDYEKKNYTYRVDVYRTYQANMISGKVDGDEAAWLDMTTCGGAFWLPTSLFSLTAAVAAGADLPHLEGRAPQSHRGLRAKNGTCAGFYSSDE